jgi:hypothetical protein
MSTQYTSTPLAITCGDTPAGLPPNSPPDPDRARVVAAWPDLPPHIRAAVLALVTAGR